MHKINTYFVIVKIVTIIRTIKPSFSSFVNQITKFQFVKLELVVS